MILHDDKPRDSDTGENDQSITSPRADSHSTSQTMETAIIPRPTTTMARSNHYPAVQPFSNFRSSSRGSTHVATSGRPPSYQSSPRGQLKLRLSPNKSEKLRDRPRTTSGLAGRSWCVKTKVKVSRLGSGGIPVNFDRNSTPSEINVYERDQLFSKFVHLGDRVIVDIASKKGD